MPGLDCKKATDWLVELDQGADRARFAVCDHETDPHTPLHIRAIEGHCAAPKLIYSFCVSCTFQSVSFQRVTLWIFRQPIQCWKRTVFFQAVEDYKTGCQVCYFSALQPFATTCNDTCENPCWTTTRHLLLQQTTSRCDVRVRP